MNSFQLSTWSPEPKTNIRGYSLQENCCPYYDINTSSGPREAPVLAWGAELHELIVELIGPWAI
jgi:hypothetical protein